MKRYFAAITSALAFSLGGSYVWAADLIETASTSGTFKTFVSAAEASGIADKLKRSGPYTVFAPADSAFEKLPPGTMDTLMKNKNKLAAMLAHHIIPGKIVVADVKPGKVQTLQGDMLTLTSDNGKITVDNANVIQSDLMADNGVIHEIDIVVLPKK